MQHRAPLANGLFVVPVHHHALVAGVNALIMDVSGGRHAPAHVPLQLGPLGCQLVIVRQCQAEQVRAVLDVGHARLPVQHQKVHALDGNVPHAAPQRRVPKDPLDTGALLELAPPGVTVDLLIVRLFQQNREDFGEHLGRLLVVLGPGQDVGLRVVVHGVGVFVRNGVEQPAACGLRLALHHVVLVAAPVLHPEPLFILNDPLVQRRLSRLVFLQKLLRLGHLLGANGLPLCRQNIFKFQFQPSCPLSQGLRSYDC